VWAKSPPDAGTIRPAAEPIAEPARPDARALPEA